MTRLNKNNSNKNNPNKNNSNKNNSNTPRSPPTNYNRCRSNKVENVMGEFKEGKLKNRGGKKISNRKQAVAIALSEADRTCKLKGKKSTEKVEEKVLNFLYNDNRKIAEERVPLSNVKQTILIISKSKKSEANKLAMALYHRVLKAMNKGIEVSPDVIQELVKMGEDLKNEP